MRHARKAIIAKVFEPGIRRDARAAQGCLDEGGRCAARRTTTDVDRRGAIVAGCDTRARSAERAGSSAQQWASARGTRADLCRHGAVAMGIERWLATRPSRRRLYSLMRIGREALVRRWHCGSIAQLLDRLRKLDAALRNQIGVPA